VLRLSDPACARSRSRRLDYPRSVRLRGRHIARGRVLVLLVRVHTSHGSRGLPVRRAATRGPFSARAPRVCRRRVRILVCSGQRLQRGSRRLLHWRLRGVLRVWVHPRLRLCRGRDLPVRRAHRVMPTRVLSHGLRRGRLVRRHRHGRLLDGFLVSDARRRMLERCRLRAICEVYASGARSERPGP